MKKIAYILTTYPCPSETFIQREITQMEKLGLEIVIFAASGKAEKPVPGQDVSIYYRPPFFSPSALWAITCTVLGHPFRTAKMVVLVVRLLFICPKEAATVFFNLHTICFFSRKTEDLSIQHVHACFLSWPACIALGVSILTKLPISVAAHARDIFVEAGAVNLKAEKAGFITCCTKQGLEYLKNNIASKYRDKLFLNYHGIEVNQSSAKLNNCSNKSEFIIAVGRLVEKKGFDCLIEAFAKVVRNCPGISLIIAGDGPLKKQLESLIGRYDLSGKVYLASWLDNDRIIKLIAQAKTLVVPSIIDTDGDRDGIPNVLLEAFSVGTPVIASSLAGISEAVINENTGFLVKPSDKTQLSIAIERLLKDETMAAFLAYNAKKMLKDSFNIENNCLKLTKLFKQNCYSENRQIKIAHVVEGFVGGMSTYLGSVLVSHKKAGFDVTLIYSPNRCDTGLSAKIKQLKEHGINVRTVPMTRAINPLVDLYCLVILTRIFTKERLDIVHTHCSKAGAVGRVAAKLAGIRQIYHSSHCFAFLRCGNFLTKKIYLFVERLLARFTSKFIAVSDSDAESAKQWKIFDEDKCIIVNNGLSTDKNPCKQVQAETISQIRESFNLPAECFVAATACRLVEYKGLFTFIETARLSKSNAVFVVAGDGPLKEKLEKYITKNNLSQKVRLLGHVCDMDRLYRICDLVVLCSTMEAQPFTLLEAMRAQCAIIASDVPGNRELLTKNRGLLVEPQPAKFVAAIDWLLTDSQKRSELAQNALSYFHSRHRLEDQVQKLIDIYRGQTNTEERTLNIADSSRTKICSEKY